MKKFDELLTEAKKPKLKWKKGFDIGEWGAEYGNAILSIYKAGHEDWRGNYNIGTYGKDDYQEEEMAYGRTKKDLIANMMRGLKSSKNFDINGKVDDTVIR